MSLQEVLKQPAEVKKEVEAFKPPTKPSEKKNKTLYFSENNLFCKGLRIKKEGLVFEPSSAEEVEVLESAFKRNYCFKKDE